MDSLITRMKPAASDGSRQRTWRERLTHPESDLGELEDAYRQSTLQSDASQITSIFYIYIAAILVYAVNDYQLFGFSTPFFVLIVARVMLVSGALLLIYALNHITSHKIMDRLILMTALIAVCLHLYIIFSRPSSLAYIDLLVVLGMYLLVPNQFYYRLIPALLFSIGDIVLFLLIRTEINPTNVFAIGGALLIGNVLGVVSSIRLFRYRRNQFRAQHENASALQEIERLASLLREVNQLLEEKVRERTAELAASNVALAKANQQLLELDKLKSSFLGVITHELRSPFVNITFSLQLIERHGMDHLLPEQREQFGQLNAGVQTAKVMIENLVKFATFLSKQGELRLSAIKLGSMVENGLMPLKFQAERKGLKLAINIPNNLPLIQGDEERLAEVVYHLVHNAIKFTDKDGTISLRGWVQGNMAHVEVKDTGIGVPADKLSTLWESFSQMSDPLQRGVEGLGLGLSLVKYVVHAHGGEVWAESQEGVGSVFGFRLPLNGS